MSRGGLWGRAIRKSLCVRVVTAPSSLSLGRNVPFRFAVKRREKSRKMAKKASDGHEGLRRVFRATRWRPFSEKHGHPTEISGVVLRIGQRASKMGDREWWVLTLREPCGNLWDVTLSAALKGLVSDAGLAVGDKVEIVYLGEEEIPGRATPMHSFDLWTDHPEAA